MTQKAITVCAAVVLVLSLGLSGCHRGGGQKPEAGSAQADSKIGDQPIQLNVATTWSTDDCAPNIALNFFKDRVTELSGGKITVILHKGTLGGEKDLYEAVRFNTVQAAAITTGPLGGYIPLAEVLMVPYIFKNWDHAFTIVDGPFGEEINRLGLEKGLRFLGWWSIGSREIYGNGPRPMVPDDLKRKKIRVMETPFLVALYKHYGAVPTPMAYTEVYTALQQGVIDGAQAGLPSYSVGHQEVTKWIALLRENLTLVPFVVSETWWKGLPQEAKDIIIEAEIETQQKARVLDQQMDGDLQKKWAKAGSTPYKPNRDAFEAKARELYPQYRSMLKNDKWFDWIVKVGEKYPLAELKY